MHNFNSNSDIWFVMPLSLTQRIHPWHQLSIIYHKFLFKYIALVYNTHSIRNENAIILLSSQWICLWWMPFSLYEYKSFANVHYLSKVNDHNEKR